MHLRLDRAAEHALARLAIRERREPRAQAEHIVVSELQRRGLFPPFADAADDGIGAVAGRVSQTRPDEREVKP